MTDRPPDQDLHAELDADQVIDRYVMGKLSAAETARFEEHYLDCAECLEQLALAERFQGSIKRAASEDAARLATFGLGTWSARWRQPRLGLALGIAALAVVLLPGIWALRELDERQQRFDTQLAEAAAPQGNTPILQLGQTRGVSTPSHLLELGPKTRWAVLSLALEPPIADTYRIVLEAILQDTGRELWAVDAQLPTPSDTLDLSLPTSLLPPGDYRLRAEPQAAGIEASTFAFRVTAVFES